MSVLAYLDVSNGEWKFEANPESGFPVVEIGFVENGGPVSSFYGLSFGFSVFANGKSNYEISYPTDGTEYEATDQKYISSDTLSLSPDDNVTMKVWAENAGSRYEGSVDFVVPRPEKPYASWVWEEGQWVAPLPKPEGFYGWDEESGQWVEANF